VIGIIYGALEAWAQTDVKKQVAYSSVSHQGFVMLGLFTITVQGVQGGVLQMINHGLSTGALFLIVGVLYERRHTRMIDAFGGLAAQIPLFTVVFGIVTFSSIGLPGLNGFIGEFLVLLGSYQAKMWIFGALAASGVILSAIYMLSMFRRVMYGTLDKEENKNLPDLNLRELFTLVPIVVLIFWIGVYPKPFLNVLEAPVGRVMDRLETAKIAAADTTLKDTELQVAMKNELTFPAGEEIE
jgi:NADH-quinone oxidoreductase subunit M